MREEFVPHRCDMSHSVHGHNRLFMPVCESMCIHMHMLLTRTSGGEAAAL